MNAPYNFGDLLNLLNKAGVTDLHNPNHQEYHSSTKWVMVIKLEEDETMCAVTPDMLLSIDTPEEDEAIGLIRLLDIDEDGDTDIDFNYWAPILISVEGIITHVDVNEFLGYNLNNNVQVICND